MAQFDTYFRVPQTGDVRHKLLDAPTPDAAQQMVQGLGFEPLGFQAVQAPPPSPTASPSVPPTSPPPGTPPPTVPTATTGGVLPTLVRGGKALIGSPEDVAQILGGIAGTKLLGPYLGRGVGGTVGGLGARMLTGALRPKPQTAAAGRAGAELLRGVPGEAFPAIVARPASRVARMFGSLADTPAVRRFLPVLGAAGASKVLGPAAETTIGEATQRTARDLRALVGPLVRSEDAPARSMAGRVTKLLRSIPAGAPRDDALLAAYTATGKKVELDKLDAATLVKLAKTSPRELILAVNAYVKKGGDAAAADGVRRSLVQSRVSRFFRESLIAPPSTPYPGAFESIRGRGGKILDPEALAKRLAAFRKQLGPDGERLAFGAKGLMALDELSRELGSNRVGAALGKATTTLMAGKAPDKSALAQATTFLTTRPFSRAMALALGGHAAGISGALEALVSEEGMASVLAHFLGTEAGIRWVTSGLSMQRRGLPEQLIVDSLARAFPNVLANLGIGPSREAQTVLGGYGALMAARRATPDWMLAPFREAVEPFTNTTP